MKKCFYCGRDNEDEALHCRECGTDQFYPGTSSNPSKPAITTCKRCGAKTEIAGAFFQVRGVLRSSPLILCPVCWARHKKFDYLRIILCRLGIGLFAGFLLSRDRNDPVGWVLLNLFAFDLALSLSILPHEFAHAFAARWMGWRVFRIFIGSGKTILKTTIAGFETEFRILPLNGLVLVAPRQLEHFRSKLFLFVLAGPMANLVIAAVMFAALGGTLAGHGLVTRQLLPLQITLFANLFIAVVNLYPQRINTPLGQHASDGRRLYEAIKADANRQKQSHIGLFCLECAVRHETKQYAEALLWVENGLKLYPDSLDLQMYSGLTLLHLEKYEPARDAFLKILERATGTESAKDRIFRAVAANNLAYTDAVTGRPELMPEADKYSQEALQVLSWTPFTKGTRGTVLLELGRPAEAMPYLLEAMQKNDAPTSKAQSACWLAIAEARQGNLNSARNYLEQARKFDPTCFLLERAQKALAVGGAGQGAKSI